ncbi:MAG: hypothetical protein ABI811_06360 [Acidobacteriota bacterium]
MSKRLFGVSWVLLAVLAAISAYGFLHERLLDEHVWTSEGARTFLIYTAVYWTVAGLLLWRWPAALGAVIAAAAVAYAAWWAGPLAPLAVIYFLGSCYCLGRLLSKVAHGVTAILLGAAVWMLVIWTALHFPVNHAWVYGIAFALPYLVWRPSWSFTFPAQREAAGSLAVLLFILLAHFFVALKPEISSDGLSMHLALPAVVADQAIWPFDHMHAIWSLMPAGADALYTGVYLLGGELAAKLLNFAFLGIVVALLVEAGRRWVSPSLTFLGAALFVSTPLVQLVTGSLFVENVWAALVLAATLALLRHFDSDDGRELLLVAVLSAAAVAVKLIAAAFAAPLAVLVGFSVIRSKAWRHGLAAAAVAVLFAAPPYLFAFAKSGNPIFPFENAVFQSPDYDAEKSFVDPRYADLQPSWNAAYEMTFRSARYVEGQGGAAGFQYFLLLAPAALLIRRRDQAMVLGVAVAGGVIVLAGAPNLRYLYAAMPLASLVMLSTGRAALPLVLIAANLFFLPSAGYYDQDFALFRKPDIGPYIQAKAPVRLLIDRLNRQAPGEVAAFFSTDATAGLHAQAYTDTWHNEHYWERVRNAPDAAATAAYFKSLGIRHVIAPANREAPFEVVRAFLVRWLDPEPAATAGTFALFRVRDAEIPIRKDTRPLTSGTHDDSEPRIEYTGAWLHDKQFAQPVGQTLSYSDTSGDRVKLTFEGRAITYVFTRAVNRGIVEIRIDGEMVRRINLYAPQTTWKSSARLAGFSPGPHTLELIVTGRKDKKASGTFVDLDAVTVTGTSESAP